MRDATAMSNPIASVVMSVFNGECFLREAIENILGQSFRDFEFVIVAFGSTDCSKLIISHYYAKDHRPNYMLPRPLVRST